MNARRWCSLAVVGACLSAFHTADAAAQAPRGSARAEPPAQEPVAITGTWTYANFGVTAALEEPSALLMDASRSIRGNLRDFVPREQQILGRVTSPLVPPPVTFEVDLPAAPRGERVRFGTTGNGVQVYVLAVCPNIVGDSYVEQAEQSCLTSLLDDPVSGAIRHGSLLVFAAAAGEPFPVAAGQDGRYFTADDPTVLLERGYTVARFWTGTVTFDRSERPAMDVLEPPASASPDFSDKGILDSYQALIDLLKERYSFTARRQLDWEAIRARYLPPVTAADTANDMAAYFLAIFDLAQSIRDSHVSAQAKAAAVVTAPIMKILQAGATSLGAAVALLTDGRVIVTWLDPDGPAARAGWRFGTEIVAIDGVRPADRLATRPYMTSQSTAEGVRTGQLEFLVKFPAGTTTTIAYKQPGEGAVQNVTLTPTGEAKAGPPAAPGDPQGISFKALANGVGYIQWTTFLEPLYRIAVWEKFLQQFHSAPGIIIDLRRNTGGLAMLYLTMASYLFPADAPAAMHWIDNEQYDDQARRFVRQRSPDYRLSSPKPMLTYDGAVVVLVGEDTASAGEYFPQFLQRLGRAKVVGEHGTRGAGGPIDVIKLPGTISFQFTMGRTLFAGTDEPNLEAKGVALDVRVPITEDGEKARLTGGDPVLDAALLAIGDEAVSRLRTRLSAHPWQFTSYFDAGLVKHVVEAPARYGITFGNDNAVAITADCNNARGTYTPGASNALAIAIGPTTRAACPPGSLGDAWVSYLGAVQSIRPGDEPGTLLLATDPSTGVIAVTLAPATGRR